MKNKLKKLYQKHREVIVFILLGGVATLINWITAYLLKLFLDERILWQNVVINTAAWITATGYAYPALRKWVFKSKNKHILKECAEFFASRFLTYVLEIALMALTVNGLHMHFWFSKVLVGLAVFVTNYAVSKLIVFRKKRRKKKKPEHAAPAPKAEAGQ